jgi:hypothetical protein
MGTFPQGNQRNINKKIIVNSMEKLVKNLKNDVYCRIKPDKFGGVGVFAIKDIPKGVDPFVLTKKNSIPVVMVPDKIVKKLPQGVKKMVKDFYHKENGMWGIPKLGLNGNDISYYLNTSKTPNVSVVNTKSCNLMTFKTNKKIKSGQQLFINYAHYDQSS